MTRPNRYDQSTQLRSPALDIKSDAGQKIYIALLERRLIMMSIRDVQMRSVCELATGIPYDSFDSSSLSYDELKEQVAKDMSRGLNLSIEEARSRVDEHAIMANPAQNKSHQDSAHASAVQRRAVEDRDQG